jgi:hypothetical protein
MNNEITIASSIGNAPDKNRTLQESAADPGATILVIDQEKKFHGEHTRRMAELKMLADVQERVVSRMLERSIEKTDQPKVPHLRVVK